MRKLLLVVVASFVISLFVAAPVQALEFRALSGSASAVNKPNNLKDKVLEQVRILQEKKQAELKEKMASKAASFRDKRKGIIKERLTKVLEHMDKVYLRLTAISEKMQNRINRFKESGVDTTQMQAALNECSSSNGALASAITEAKSKVAAITDNGDADGTARAALQSVKSVYEAVKNYYRCLLNVNTLIRASIPKEGTAGAN